MRVIIAGSRIIRQKYVVYQSINEAVSLGMDIGTVITGGAIGVDSLAEQWAKERDIDREIYNPDWTVGKHAGFLRNQKMADVGEALILIWNGKSNGSKDMLSRAKKRNLILFQVVWEFSEGIWVKKRSGFNTL